MDLEARSLQPGANAMMLAKLREHKSDLNKLKREIKRVTSPNANEIARDELLESGMSDMHAVSSDQREKVAMSVERLNQSSDMITESRRAILETEELGVSILQDLQQQRETLLHSHKKASGSPSRTNKQGKGLDFVARRDGVNDGVEGNRMVDGIPAGLPRLHTLPARISKPIE